MFAGRSSWTPHAIHLELTSSLHSLLTLLQITRLYPRIFSALPLNYLEAVLAFAERGLAMQEQFSLKTTIELLVSPTASADSRGHASDRQIFLSAVERAANADGVAVRHDVPKRRPATDSVDLALNTLSDRRRSAPVALGLSERAAACLSASRAGSGPACTQGTPCRAWIPDGASYARVEGSLRACYLRVSALIHNFARRAVDSFELQCTNREAGPTSCHRLCPRLPRSRRQRIRSGYHHVLAQLSLG